MDLAPSHLWSSPGADLHALHDVVRDDLPTDGRLLDLAGGGWFTDEDPFVRREEIPRIRPILVALAARAAGAEHVDGEPLYAAELLHMALVVHDLALGRQGGRRRRVARRVVRRSVAWLGGNHLTVRALELCRHSSPEILSELVDTLRQFADGQALARELQQGLVPSGEDWLEHADAHTGALFAFCCRAGGHLAGADATVLSALGRHGRHLGRLWHVAEDLSALEHGDAAAHLANRAQAARPALPVVAAIEREPRLGDRWLALVADPDPRLAREVAPRILALGRGPSRAVMVREAWAARKALRSLPPSRYRTAMERLAKGLAQPGEGRGEPSSP